MKWILIIPTLLVMIAAILVVAIPANAPTDGPSTTAKAQLDDLIVLDSPLPGATISSPVTITGKARGPWYFEASFPVSIVDWDGRIIAQAPAQAHGEWMTEEYVPFSVTLTFDTPIPGDPSVNRGAIILQKDNPSGLPEHDRALEVPIVFK